MTPAIAVLSGCSRLDMPCCNQAAFSACVSRGQATHQAAVAVLWADLLSGPQQQATQQRRPPQVHPIASTVAWAGWRFAGCLNACTTSACHARGCLLQGPLPPCVPRLQLLFVMVLCIMTFSRKLISAQAMLARLATHSCSCLHALGLSGLPVSWPPGQGGPLLGCQLLAWVQSLPLQQ